MHENAEMVCLMICFGHFVEDRKETRTCEMSWMNPEVL